MENKTNLKTIEELSFEWGGLSGGTLEGHVYNYFLKATEELRKENEGLLAYQRIQHLSTTKHLEDNAKFEKEIERLKESNKELEERLKQHLPSECVDGWDEVKFCPTRQGEGGKCKWCS